MFRGLDLEQKGRFREAAAAYREAISTAPDPQGTTQAILGLERAYAELGWSDSILVVVDSALRTRPKDATIRTVQFRTLQRLGRSAEAQRAFEAWVAAAPRDPVPFREYARLLMESGRAAAADTVLQRAARTLGGTRSLAGEVAQMRAATGKWEESARAWREALEDSPYLEQAAVFALQPTPASTRPAVRKALLDNPVRLGARRILAQLELNWGSPTDAWRALATLPPTDSAANAWSEFASRAEVSEAWGVARDALVAAYKVTPSTQLAIRGATAALNGNDATSALVILRTPLSSPDSSRVARTVLPLQVRALTLLGRTTDAERSIASYARFLDDDTRATLTRTIAWGWVRAGDVNKARAALAASGVTDDDEVSGWLALYEGDLKTAKAALRRSADASPDLVSAMAVLARTRADRSPEIGAAFLSLAHGDSADAARKFVEAGRAASDAEPLLVAIAARLYTARRDDKSASALWQRLVESFATSPEAPEADLEWGRALKRGGNVAAATERFEHLILTYPSSALVPQARRELELAKGARPPNS